MRLISLFKKTMIENIRDWKILILTLTFAPFFVVLMYFYYQETTQSPYKIVVVNQDKGISTTDNSHFNAGEGLISAMMDTRSSEGTTILEVQQESDLDLARKRLSNRAVDLVVEIPEQFTEVLEGYRQGSQPSPAIVRTYGDPANVRYIMASAWSDMITYQYAAVLAGVEGPLELEAETVSGGKVLSEFEIYVPGLLALALIMLMFTAAASLIKEKDKGTIVRLRISNMTPYEWLGAVSLTQVIIGLLALMVTLWTAVALGYHTSGSMSAVLVVGLLSCLAIIAISLMVAAFLRTIFDLLTIGCFPFFILMFFSGGMFPLPPLRLFTMGNRSIDINDILPTTHSISALDRILNYGADLTEVGFELGAIVALTAVFFTAGAWLFTRRHLRPA